jgi:ribosome biogenesis protein MAK21
MDPLAYVRTQALSLTYTLLRDKPEQEHNLLRLLVNKLVSGKKMQVVKQFANHGT